MSLILTNEDVIRFWSRVKVLGPDDCWEWQACINSNYGVLVVKKKNQKAHRVSYVINVGVIPDGLLVCHRCDNTICVNPNHLFLGTNKDNMLDKMSKGRQVNPLGVKHGRAKLTEIQVLKIRQDARLLREVAKEYKVNIMTISNIRSGKNWKHLK
jgi:hypothetical protein